MVEHGRPASRASRTASLIGGQAATSWSVLGAFSALLIADRLGTDLERTGRPSILLSSALVGSLTVLIVLRASRASLLRTVIHRPRPLATLLCLASAAVGAAFVGRIHDERAGLPIDPSPAFIVQRTGWGFTVLLLLSMGAMAIAGHRSELAALIERASTLRHVKGEIELMLATAVDSQRAKVVEEVRAATAGLEHGDFSGAIVLLRRLGVETVRPRSHALAAAGHPYRPSKPRHLPSPAGIRELAGDVIADRPIRPALPASMVALWGTAFTFADTGLVGSLLRGAVLGVLALVVWSAFAVVIRRLLIGCRLRTRIVIVICAVFGAASCWIATAEALEQLLGLTLPTGETPLQRFVQALTLSVIPFTQMFSRAMLRRGELAVEDVRRSNDLLQIEVARANAQLWTQRRALARELHGPMQSAVDAATLRLMQAEHTGIPLPAAISQAKDAIGLALDRLERWSASGREPERDELDRTVQRIRGLWEGLARIGIDIEDGSAEALRADASLQAALVDALTEACSNAVRHGRAENIDVRISLGPRRLNLEVIDDGRAGATSDPGFGSKLLDEVALDWQLRQDTSGARLSVSFARA